MCSSERKCHPQAVLRTVENVAITVPAAKPAAPRGLQFVSWWYFSSLGGGNTTHITV